MSRPAQQRGIDPLGQLVVEIFRLNGLLLESGDRLTKDLGLTSARWQVLGAIELAGHPQSVSQIARSMGLTRQSVQRIANELDADGMVSFSENPDHARAKLVVPSAKGRKAFADAMRRQKQWAKQVRGSAGVSERNIRVGQALMRKLRVALENM